MFEDLEIINQRPRPFEFNTTEQLWTDPYVSARMLEYHLNEEVDLSSRNRAFVERSVAWIIECFGLAPAKSVCDFGCGPGLYTTPLAEAGASVTGIDFSATSINHARNTASERGLAIDYVLKDYLRFETQERFDLIMMIFCDYCVIGPDKRAELLAKWRGMLAEGGALLLDVSAPAQYAAVEEFASYNYSPADGFWAAGPYYEFQNAFKYDDRRLLLFKHTIFEERRIRWIYNWLQCFDLEAITAEFAASGLKIIEHYANVAGDAPDPAATELAVVAVKA